MEARRPILTTEAGGKETNALNKATCIAAFFIYVFAAFLAAAPLPRGSDAPVSEDAGLKPTPHRILQANRNTFTLPGNDTDVAFVREVHCYGGGCAPYSEWQGDPIHEWFPDPNFNAKITYRLDIYNHIMGDKNPRGITFYESVYWNSDPFAYIPIKEAPVANLVPPIAPSSSGAIGPAGSGFPGGSGGPSSTGGSSSVDVLGGLGGLGGPSSAISSSGAMSPPP